MSCDIFCLRCDLPVFFLSLSLATLGYTRLLGGLYFTGSYLLFRHYYGAWYLSTPYVLTLLLAPGSIPRVFFFFFSSGADEQSLAWFYGV